MSAKAKVQAVSNKLFYGTAGKHIAGQHSLTMGELACFIIAAVMMLWGSKIPVIGKFCNVYTGLVVIFIAFVVW